MSSLPSSQTTSGAPQALPRLAILDDYHGVALTMANWDPIRTRVSTIDVFRDTLHDEDAIVERLESYDILCTMRERTKLPQSLLERLPNLKYISTTGLRNRGIDSTFARTRTIPVSGTNTGGNSTVEHIFALLLALVRQIPAYDAHMKSGSNPLWQQPPASPTPESSSSASSPTDIILPMGLAGRTLGLIGVGRLGTSLAALGKLLGMRVIGWSPNFTPSRALAVGVEYAASKECLLSHSDVVSLHLVLSSSTRHILRYEVLCQMKRSAYLLNTARGALVDEEGLIRALEEGEIRGVGLDVFYVEPLPAGSRLRGGDWGAGRVVVTPHMAYVSDTNYEVFYRETVENVLGFLEGSLIRVYED